MSTLVPLRARDGQVRAHARIDSSDADLVNRWRWSLNSSGYAFGSPGFMHNLILGDAISEGLQSDHINFDRLDNRRENLRAVPIAENRLRTRRHIEATRLREAAVALWDAGMSRAEIVTELGCQTSLVSAALRGRKENPHPNLKWTPERLVEATQAFVAEHGRIPSIQEYDGHSLPWFTRVYRQFGGMAELREAAGFGRIDLREEAA